MKYIIFISVLMFVVGYIYGSNNNPTQLKLSEINKQKEFVLFKDYLNNTNNINIDEYLISYERYRYLKGTIPLYGKNEVVTSLINYLMKGW